MADTHATEQSVPVLPTRLRRVLQGTGAAGDWAAAGFRVGALAHQSYTRHGCQPRAGTSPLHHAKPVERRVSQFTALRSWSNLQAVFGAIISAVAAGFVMGAAARFALPGPDPMPFSLTVLIGLAGSLAGGGIAAGIFGGTSHAFDTSGHAFATLMLELGAAVAVLAGYRRFVQKRPLWGPEAHLFPERGFGVARMRARLRQLGIDPDRLPGRGGAAPTQKDPGDVAEELEKLRDLRDKGILTDEAYEEARERLRRY